MPKDGQGSSNAFVELHFDGQKFRTTIKEKDLDPFWSETFYFNVSNPTDLHNLTLEAHVYSMNKTAIQNRPSGSIFSRARGELGLKVYVTDDPYIKSAPLPEMSSSSSHLSLHSSHDELPSQKVEESIPDVVTNGKKGLRRTFYNLSSSNNQRQQPPPATSQQPIQYGVMK
ncbi:UNVERIFIED_CONTAM: protein QUIRKY [Sesamum angustifolium]|uniref:Protein QUIRKY n=1 Tax=Sesamum angustifolium TaxID=2727405 RepID=A0AAW2RHS3_9LAMI